MMLRRTVEDLCKRIQLRMRVDMKILEAIKTLFEFLWQLVETIVYIPGYLIWVIVACRRMNKRYIKNTKRNRKKYGIKMDQEENDEG